MAIDYDAIANDQARLERTAANSIRTLANLYAERAHFVFELLQNAEDALRRRGSEWRGSRTVSFDLAPRSLRVSHYGEPFNSADVQAICSVGETTKELTDIGRFGIGFKSVHAFTDRPTVHSGLEDFAIADFVRPVATPAIRRELDETVILMPLRTGDDSGHGDIARGLETLGASALLFLRQIEEVHWSVEGGRSGLYLRESRDVASGVRRVTLVGQEQAQPEFDEEWLVFSKEVAAKDEQLVGRVEIAFSVHSDGDLRGERIQRVARSPLVVFFPTVLETHLGFFVQGPYRTTPGRDNVPSSDTWNQRLVSETASLLGQSLCWLRDHGFLDTAALRCLPLDSLKFREGSMFAPLYQFTKAALASEPLLPRFGDGYVPAGRARLARTQELRDLFKPAQLAALFGAHGELVWLNGEITSDRTPDLHRYLVQELRIPELTPTAVVSQLNKDYLEAQSDDWIGKLYEFLNGQPGLLSRLEDLPLIRLEDGSHVAPNVDGLPQAFLPTPIATGFPLVRAAVCATPAGIAFLKSLGLTAPDPVDDIVRNVLPMYQRDEVDVSDADYKLDIARILNAFTTDSKVQRDKLLAALRETSFVMAVAASDAGECVSKPGDVYLATERLKELFAGVSGVTLVDDSYSCLKGEDVRELLEACGATRYLQPVSVECGLSWEQRTEIRRNAGLKRFTWEHPIADASLRGLEPLLSLLSQLEPLGRKRRAALLWDALSDVESRRGSGAFVGTYTWGYSHETKTATFDAAFVNRLNEASWIPDADGNLHSPKLVVFDTLGWKPNPFLQSTIRFKPPILDQLAKEAGIEPGLLDLLRKLGVTSEAGLRERLRVEDDPTVVAAGAKGDVGDALTKLLGDAPEPTPPVPDPAGRDPVISTTIGNRGGEGRSTVGGETSAGHGTRSDESSKGNGAGDRGAASKRTPGSANGRPFISYVAAHAEDEGPDPDGLDQPARMELEAEAIELILSREPEWRRTPTHNPGFDLYQGDEQSRATCWCEVKAMTGSLVDRPVGLSRTQFECAREKGMSYWLYVVERAGTDDARIVRIQNPVGKARTFTFDHGWLDVAAVDNEPTDRED